MPARPITLKPLSVRTAHSSVIAVEKPRLSPTDRGYDGDWKRLRARYLKEHPTCKRCREKRRRITAAEVVNHIEDIKDRPDLRLDESNLESLCKQCHNRHTAIRMNEERKQRKSR